MTTKNHRFLANFHSAINHGTCILCWIFWGTSEQGDLDWRYWKGNKMGFPARASPRANPDIVGSQGIEHPDGRMAIYARLYDETNDDRREDIQANSAYVKSLFFMSAGRPGMDEPDGSGVLGRGFVATRKSSAIETGAMVGTRVCR